MSTNLGVIYMYRPLAIELAYMLTYNGIYFDWY